MDSGWKICLQGLFKKGESYFLKRSPVATICSSKNVSLLLLAGAFCTLPVTVALPDKGGNAPSSAQKTAAGELLLVPLPNQIVKKQGAFKLSGKTRILYDANAPEYEKNALYLQKILHQSTGNKIAVEKHSGNQVPKGAILLKKVTNTSPGNEGYGLAVSPDSIIIDGLESAGVFYGIQSLLQLLPTEIYAPGKVSGVAWSVPCVEIADSPAYKWRGLMLDCSRQFFTVDEIKRLLDQMAFNKLNTFHWHFTDDNGWRMEIKGYPRLTDKGATWVGSGYPDNGKTLFYTQDDIKDIVSYAKNLHITVVPEIELPGHALAAILSYPELFCQGAPLTEKMMVTDFWTLFHKVGYTPPVCVTRPEAVKFMHTVLDQVMDLFPSEYIHVGGDEIKEKDRKWSQCPSCKVVMDRKGYTDNDMQKYLAENLRDYVAKRGKKIIGWSEIFNKGAISGVALMDWIGGGDVALKNGCELIASPTSTSYLDYDETPGDPVTDGGVCTMSSVYNYDMGQGLDAENQKLILGSQGNLWTHIARNEEEMNFCLFPRLSAVAERNWTERENKSFPDFLHRMQGQYARLAIKGVNFNVPEPVCSFERKDGTRSTLVIHNPAGKTGKVYYTLDGTEPSESSTLYKGAVLLPEETGSVQAVTIVKEGQKSRVTKAVAPPKAGYYCWTFDKKSPDEKNKSLKTESVGNVSYVTGRNGKGTALRLAEEQAALTLNGAPLQGDWTFSVWVNAFSDKSPFSFLISGSEGSLRLLSGKKSGKLEASIRNGRENDFNYALPLNVWTMLSFVQTKEGLSLYVDGVLKETFAGFVMPLPMTMIGNYGEWGYKSLNADLDEIIIFPRALTTSEVESLYKGKIPSSK